MNVINKILNFGHEVDMHMKFILIEAHLLIIKLIALKIVVDTQKNVDILRIKKNKKNIMKIKLMNVKKNMKNVCRTRTDDDLNVMNVMNTEIQYIFGINRALNFHSFILTNFFFSLALKINFHINYLWLEL